jgi:RimJ/RimL family protein N-acetyltransferase
MSPLPTPETARPTKTVSLEIPVFETARLTLREPRMTDVDPFAAFLASERSRFVGGPRTLADSARALGHFAGLWLLRGYGPHVFCLKDGTPIGHGGPWFPRVWAEPEFGWCLWSAEHEGKGYVTEALRRLMDWSFSTLVLSTAVSYVDPDNLASVRVARALGGVEDPGATPPDDDPVVIFRYRPEGVA